MMCLAAIASIAQGISGRVIDEHSQPMPFVNVVLLNRADSTFTQGAVTKDDGTFSIYTDKQDGLLKVSSVGYMIRYIDAQQGNVGDIQMQPCHEEALRTAARQKIDRYIEEHSPVETLPRFYLVLLRQQIAPMEQDGMSRVYQV